MKLVEATSRLAQHDEAQQLLVPLTLNLLRRYVPVPCCMRQAWDLQWMLNALPPCAGPGTSTPGPTSTVPATTMLPPTSAGHAFCQWLLCSLGALPAGPDKAPTSSLSALDRCASF